MVYDPTALSTEPEGLQRRSQAALRGLARESSTLLAAVSPIQDYTEALNYNRTLGCDGMGNIVCLRQDGEGLVFLRDRLCLHQFSLIDLI